MSSVIENNGNVVLFVLKTHNIFNDASGPTHYELAHIGHLCPVCAECWGGDSLKPASLLGPSMLQYPLLKQHIGNVWRALSPQKCQTD